MNAHGHIDPDRAGEEWEETLARSGYRRTEPRRVILQAITHHAGPFTAESLADELRSSGVGRATVFRTIDVMTDLGMLHRLHTGGCHGYTVCPPGHHHHLTCSACGRVESVEGCGLDEQLARLAGNAGFAIEEHHLELSGLCADCH
ncbi:MAG TPA: Fur family transcriptional regulator [Chloroflexota bacterium]